MSILASIKHMWDQGEEEDYVDDELLDSDEPQATSNSSKYAADKYSSEKYSTNYGGDGPSRGRPLRSVPIPLRAREKNIYTLRPKNQDEAAIAADYLKSGSAVVMNLETVERMVAVRIIDFMSGVCYGLEGQGHAMKLGDSIFLFTPAEFEISSDELDYGENRDFFFKDVDAPTAAPQAKTQSAAPAGVSASASTPVSTPPASVSTPPAAPSSGSTTPSGYATADYTAPNAVRPPEAKMSTPAPTSVAAAPAITSSSPSTTVSSPVPVAPRNSTLPGSSVYGSGGKAHVLVGGKPASASAPSPAPAPNPSQVSYQSSERRSWER